MTSIGAILIDAQEMEIHQRLQHRALTVGSVAQQSSPSPAELRFEVASIKRSPPILDRPLQPFVGVSQPVIAACFSPTPQRRPKGDSNP
jgi:hypothetical protein